MSKLIGNQEFNGDVYVKGVGGYDGTNATASTVETIQTVLSANIDSTTAHTANETIHITEAERTAWNSKASGVQADWNTTATTDASYIKNKPTIPTVPTSNTAFTNDAGYITGYTETDPTVPEWAKASSKPTYTASEVGALPTGTTLDNVADGTTRKLSNYATTETVNTLNNAVTAHTADTTIHVTDTEKSTWNGKQDVISDLATIRTNAASGMSAYNDVNALSAGTIDELSKKSSTGHTHTISEVNGLQSALDGKSGTGHTHNNYATTETVNTLNNTVTAHTANTAIHVTTAQTAAWDGKQDAISDLETIRSNASAGAAKVSNVQADWNTTATTDESYIKNKPTIPTVPTSNTAFTNDAGYITGYTETDPTVPEWAKAASKPSYTANEVGALPTGATLDDVVDGTTRKLSNYATTGTVNTLSDTVTAHTANTAIHVTTAQTSAWDGKQDTISDLETIRSNAEAGAAKVSNVQADWNATTGLAVILNKPTIPSAPGTLTTTATTAQSTATNEVLTGNISLHKVSKTGSYNDLTNKPTIPTVPAWATASTKPTYTASEVGALPTGTTLDGIADGTTRKLSNYATTGTVNTHTGTTIPNRTSGQMHLPTVSASDNGKILMVKNGAWVLEEPSTITYSSSAPSGGKDGDIWIQTS